MDDDIGWIRLYLRDIGVSHDLSASLIGRIIV